MASICPEEPLPSLPNTPPQFYLITLEGVDAERGKKSVEELPEVIDTDLNFCAVFLEAEGMGNYLWSNSSDISTFRGSKKNSEILKYDQNSNAIEFKVP